MINKIHNHAFIRTDRGNVNIIAVVDITDSEKDTRSGRSAKEALEALKKAITRWVSETDEGAEAYANSSEDYNIGDFLGDFESLSFAPYLASAGIECLEINTLSPDETNSYDHHLVDESGL